MNKVSTNVQSMVGASKAAQGGQVTADQSPIVAATLEALTGNDFATPHQECDIVMKGGVTSGVVYPPAILRIAQRFRFKNIGGTSAGAIAAAMTAAAEFRGIAGPGARGAGFMLFKKGVLDWLSSGTNLQSLFVPTVLNAPLFYAFLWLIGLASARRRPTVRGIVNLIVTVGLVIIAVWGGIDAFFGPFALIPSPVARGVAIVFIAAILWLVITLLALLPRSNFGTCTGGRKSALPSVFGLPFEPLTFWLARQIDSIANTGAERPLTFGDLWAGAVRGQMGNTDKPNAPMIDLQMVTTCLTLGRPYRLPFETNIFYFRPDELRKFFPEYVVKWMVDHALPPDPSDSDAVPRQKCMALLGYIPLPPRADLPVVFCTRLSLSFPILLSAIRLYAIDFSRAVNAGFHNVDWQNDPAKRLMPDPVWFSDGGLSSNFPIALFDEALPKRPTLAITLESFPPPDSRSAGDAVWMPNSNAKGVGTVWNRFSPRATPSNMVGFLGTIIDTMQNWQDSMQSIAPGARDRIAHVRLSSIEGGLNLTMPAKVIRNLVTRGWLAGDALVQRFTVPPLPGVKMTWDNHRWVRFRAAGYAIQRYATQFTDAWEAPTAPSPSYADLLTASGTLSYPLTNLQEAAAESIVTSLGQVEAATRTPAQSLKSKAPHPITELLARPRF